MAGNTDDKDDDDRKFRDHDDAIAPQPLEPATLTMFGIGILGFGGAALWRRKRAAA